MVKTSFKCGYCVLTLTTKQRLKSHLKSKHKHAKYRELTDNSTVFLSADASKIQLRAFEQGCQEHDEAIFAQKKKVTAKKE